MAEVETIDPALLEGLPVLAAVDFGSASISSLADEELDEMARKARDKKSSSKKKKELLSSLQDIKKQKRLIRNRYSAQLHRERKEFELRKLSFEISKQADEILLLKQHIQYLQAENGEMRELLGTSYEPSEQVVALSQQSKQKRARSDDLFAREESIAQQPGHYHPFQQQQQQEQQQPGFPSSNNGLEQGNNYRVSFPKRKQRKQQQRPSQARKLQTIQEEQEQGDAYTLSEGFLEPLLSSMTTSEEEEDISTADETESLSSNPHSIFDDEDDEEDEDDMFGQGTFYGHAPSSIPFPPKETHLRDLGLGESVELDGLSSFDRFLNSRQQEQQGEGGRGGGETVTNSKRRRINNNKASTVKREASTFEPTSRFLTNTTPSSFLSSSFSPFSFPLFSPFPSSFSSSSDMVGHDQEENDHARGGGGVLRREAALPSWQAVERELISFESSLGQEQQQEQQEEESSFFVVREDGVTPLTPLSPLTKRVRRDPEIVEIEEEEEGGNGRQGERLFYAFFVFFLLFFGSVDSIPSSSQPSFVGFPSLSSSSSQSKGEEELPSFASAFSPNQKEDVFSHTQRILSMISEQQQQQAVEAMQEEDEEEEEEEEESYEVVWPKVERREAPLSSKGPQEKDHFQHPIPSFPLTPSSPSSLSSYVPYRLPSSASAEDEKNSNEDEDDEDKYPVTLYSYFDKKDLTSSSSPTNLQPSASSAFALWPSLSTTTTNTVGGVNGVKSSGLRGTSKQQNALENNNHGLAVYSSPFLSLLSEEQKEHVEALLSPESLSLLVEQYPDMLNLMASLASSSSSSPPSSSSSWPSVASTPANSYVICSPSSSAFLQPLLLQELSARDGDEEQLKNSQQVTTISLLVPQTSIQVLPSTSASPSSETGDKTKEGDGVTLFSIPSSLGLPDASSNENKTEGDANEAEDEVQWIEIEAIVTRTRLAKHIEFQG